MVDMPLNETKQNQTYPGRNPIIELPKMLHF